MHRIPAIAGFVLAVAIALAWLVFGHLQSRIPPPPDQGNPLVVMLRPGPATDPGDADTGPVGLDADLARQFATERGYPLRFVIVRNEAQLLVRVRAGEAHAGAGAMVRPTAPEQAAAEADRGATPDGDGPSLAWTRGTYSVAPVLIFAADSLRPTGWLDLVGEVIATSVDAGMAPVIEAVRAAHPEITWRADHGATAIRLIAQVSAGEIPYAVVGSDEAAIARKTYIGFDVAFAVGDAREVAWVVPARFAGLGRELDAFLARIARDGTLQRLVTRHFAAAGGLAQVDAGVLRERIVSVLPPLRSHFRNAQEATGVEWRLLAAIAYQESQWDPLATSETGVRGIMQLTADTARSLGDIDRLDPKASILAAARYLRDLEDRLPPRIAGPDRTWLALAAFNIGYGHLEDARVLAQRQKLNPDLWSDVRKVLPLLALPEFYSDLKQGYARGGMPVAFVDRVRAYYDVLLATQPPHQPRLRVSVTPARAAAD